LAEAAAVFGRSVTTQDGVSVGSARLKRRGETTSPLFLLFLQEIISGDELILRRNPGFSCACQPKNSGAR